MAWEEFTTADHDKHSQAGRSSSPRKGFGSNRELARAAGRVGGMISRRGITRQKASRKQINEAHKHLSSVSHKTRQQREKGLAA